jgi:hypothetical protein
VQQQLLQFLTLPGWQAATAAAAAALKKVSRCIEWPVGSSCLSQVTCMAILPTQQQQQNGGSSSGSSGSSSGSSSSSSRCGCWDVDWTAAGEALQAVRAEGFTLAGFRVLSPGSWGSASGFGNVYGSQGCSSAGGSSGVGQEQQQQQCLQQLAHVLKLTQKQVEAIKQGLMLVLALAKDNAVVRLQACMAAALQQQQQQQQQHAFGRDWAVYSIQLPAWLQLLAVWRLCLAALRQQSSRWCFSLMTLLDVAHGLCELRFGLLYSWVACHTMSLVCRGA